MRKQPREIPPDAGLIFRLTKDEPEVGARAGQRVLVLNDGRAFLYSRISAGELLHLIGANPGLAVRLAGREALFLLFDVPALEISRGDILMRRGGHRVEVGRTLASDAHWVSRLLAEAIPGVDIDINVAADEAGLDAADVLAALRQRYKPQRPKRAPRQKAAEDAAIRELLSQVGCAMPQRRRRAS